MTVSEKDAGSMTPPLSEEQIAEIQKREWAARVHAAATQRIDASEDDVKQAYKDRALLLAYIDHLKSLPQTEGVGAAPRDTKCRELAEHFLSDIDGYRKQDVQELADRIQHECKAFCRDIEALQVRDE